MAQRTASTDAREFHQHAVARGLDDAPAVFRDFRIQHLAAMRLEAFERRFLGRSHQPRVARHIWRRSTGCFMALLQRNDHSTFRPVFVGCKQRSCGS
jgi:hypothetical protein